MNEAPPTIEELALSNCEREQVHLPGRIQSFGALLGFDPATLSLCYASENASEFIGCGVDEAFGRKLDDLLSKRELVHAVRNTLGIPSIERQRERVGVYQVGQHDCDVAVSANDGVAVLELERATSNNSRANPPVALIRGMMSDVCTTAGLDRMLDSAVINLRKLTGFDRVMAYQFLDRGEGEVKAEARSPGVEPYLGLRYPASDIPENVRRVMVRNPYRVIHDIEDEHSPIKSAKGFGELDVSLTHLRGVSPIHIEYLRNMGVSATMNLALIVRGSLWGMFALHHYRPILLPAEHRSVCELFGSLISLQLQQQLEQETVDQRRRADSVLRSLAGSTGLEGVKIVSDAATDLMEVVDCDGIALVEQEHIRRWGVTPSDRVIQATISSSKLAASAFDTLDDVDGATVENGVAGALVVELGPQSQSHLVFFRKEVLLAVRWAGADQTKQIEHGPNGPRLHPRSSFAEYQQSIAGRCKPWSDATISAALQARATLRDLLYLSHDASQTEWRAEKKKQDLLIAELNHRVKNILALVRSIATQTRDSAKSLEQYASAFEQRIAALSNAHDLIGGSGAQWARLQDMVDAELVAFRQSNASIAISGPPVAVRADAAPLVALVFHELVSNAVKYGALSSEGKALSIHWQRESGGLAIHWSEKLTGPRPKQSRQGFGLTLIQRAVPHELGGDCSLDFQDDGLSVRFWLPNDVVRSVPKRKITEEQPKRTSNDSLHLTGNRRDALVVEDNMILAMEMESLLIGLGFRNVFSFGRAENCWSEWKDRKLAGVIIAILDVNLGGNTSFELAEKLLTAGVHVVFVSGYDQHFPTPESLLQVPRLRKPVEQDELAEAIGDLVRQEK